MFHNIGGPRDVTTDYRSLCQILSLDRILRVICFIYASRTLKITSYSIARIPIILVKTLTCNYSGHVTNDLEIMLRLLKYRFWNIDAMFQRVFYSLQYNTMHE